MDAEQKRLIRELIITDNDETMHWIARHLPWRLVRAVVILACRDTGRINLLQRHEFIPVSAEDVVQAVLRAQERAERKRK